MTQEILLVVVGIAAGLLVAWWLLRGRGRAAGPDHNWQALQDTVTTRLDKVTEQLDARLRDNVRAMQESKSFLADRVSSTERTVRAVSTELGKLEQATAALNQTNQEISSFQQMLRHPKVRGSFGEVLLTNLLAAILPSDRFTTQYTLPASGDIADAVIHLQDGFLVAIDAKFPLSHYEALVKAEDEATRHAAKVAFIRDVKKHVMDIAGKYISPHDHTLDYAFMYIPLEGVYYEAIVHDQLSDDLGEFCLKHKVIPVSPNSFMAYLQTVLIGLRGLKIEQQAKEILKSLSQVRQDFGQFSKDFAMVGTHLTNAKNRFDDSARRLDKFSNRLEQVETTTSAGLPETTET